MSFALLLILVLSCVAMQYFSGCYHSDFSAESDEPGHVVSSLAVWAYFAQGPIEHPIQFADNYYLHYPKLAIGHWPPLFYCAQALWISVTGVRRASFLTFMAIVSVALWAGVFVWLDREYGRLIAFFSVAALITPAIMQLGTFTVRPDLFMALFVFGAAVSYGKYLETSQKKYLTAFWILAAACVSTHGRGIAFFLIPAIAGLMVRGPGAYRLRSYLLVAALLIFGTVLARVIGQSFPFAPRAALVAALRFPYYVGRAFGWPVAILAGVGAIAVFRDRARRVQHVPMLAAVVSVWALAATINVSWSPAYLICVAPAFAVLFGTGWRAVAAVLEAWAVPARIAALGLAALSCVVIARAALPVQHKLDTGFHRTLESELPGGKIILIAASPRLEGALISELALREKSPDHHIVLRASKVLSWSTWVQGGYHLLYADERGVAGFMDQAHVGLIVVGPPERPDIAQLTASAAARPEMWTPVAVPNPPSGVNFFLRTGPMPEGKPEIHIDMKARIGRKIETH